MKTLRKMTNAEFALWADGMMQRVRKEERLRELVSLQWNVIFVLLLGILWVMIK